MTTSEENSPLITLDHVLDFYNRYPGETATFFTRFTVESAVADLTLRLSLPAGLTVGDYQAPAGQSNPVPRVEVSEGVQYVVWQHPGQVPAGSSFEYQTQATILPIDKDRRFKSEAVITTGDDDELGRDSVTLAVQAQGRYLQYLPALYARDDFMRRFVMLFESFWQPIESQIDHTHYYFDPRTAPAEFLPWLASWLDLELDERWDETHVRQLIRWAIALHRSRGTRWGLLKYLEIYTGQKAKVTEHISNNFVLGPEARLGASIALGRGNQPHTFSVSLRLPIPEGADAVERAREEKLQRRTIESIINNQKPAHTVYTLDLQFVPPEELDWQTQEPETYEAEAIGGTDEITAQAATWFKLDNE